MNADKCTVKSYIYSLRLDSISILLLIHDIHLVPSILKITFHIIIINTEHLPLKNAHIYISKVITPYVCMYTTLVLVILLLLAQMIL